MGEPTLREDLERQARRFGVDVAVAVSLLPEGRLDDPRAALTVTASELSDIIEPMILALLDRRVPTLSPGNQEDSLSREPSPTPVIGAGSAPNNGAEPIWAAAAWRRGIMHAIERIDLALKPGKPVPKGRMAATIEAIRTTLDDLTEFQRQARPRTYEEAFDLCAADYAAARDGATTTRQLGASAASTGTPSNPSPTLSPEGSGDE